ncbi:hypothetical protein RHGRI_026470 [Rhododendron griersonianum]|uniref:Glucan endo-1,3-beta-D-glucosidase n=1 Tax=Rhododendron griersonianum TaxID=479676 RepID=A0AAV6IXE3_9ERIC|nr:hypothetical protein RHGRI_026470 [Rhododendron griersonianum]
MKLIAQKKGTPLRPNSDLNIFVFALFNENMKPGPTSERNYGLLKPDGTQAYGLGLAGVSAVGGNSGGGELFDGIFSDASTAFPDHAQNISTVSSSPPSAAGGETSFASTKTFTGGRRGRSTFEFVEKRRLWTNIGFIWPLWNKSSAEIGDSLPLATLEKEKSSSSL